MVKFVIVEDEESTQQKVRKVIRSVVNGKNNEEELDIETFKKYGESLRKVITDTSMHKVYVLDVELANSISGIEIAKLIRKNDWDSEIIFITSHDKMFETVYRSIYEVFDFIEKFHDMESRLAKDLKEIISRKFDSQMFTYKSRNIDFQIYYKSILYIYRDKKERKIIIQTDTNCFKLNLTMAEALSLLDTRFKTVHRACIVNTERVMKYNWSKGTFLLDTGEEVPLLSRKYKKEVE